MRDSDSPRQVSSHVLFRPETSPGLSALSEGPTQNEAQLKMPNGQQALFAPLAKSRVDSSQTRPPDHSLHVPHLSAPGHVDRHPPSRDLHSQAASMHEPSPPSAQQPHTRKRTAGEALGPTDAQNVERGVQTRAPPRSRPDADEGTGDDVAVAAPVVAPSAAKQDTSTEGSSRPTPSGLQDGVAHSSSASAPQDGPRVALHPLQTSQPRPEQVPASAHHSRPACDVALGNMDLAPPRIRALLRNNRLVLLLDLDHTLLESVGAARLSGKAQELVSLQAEAGAAGLHWVADLRIWTKLRPGVGDFLQWASAFFECWVFTNGTSAYAAQMVQLLDSQGTLFADRVIAQGREDGSPFDQTKRLRSGLAQLEPIIVAFDDTAQVWAEHASNLMLVERYKYFSQGCYLEQGCDESPENGTLYHLCAALLRVHSRVWGRLQLQLPPPSPAAAAEVPWDVRAALRVERRQLLAGCVLLFTGHDRRVLRELWRLAESLGAQVEKSPSTRVTHAVSGNGWTGKAWWAQQQNKWVVLSHWVHSTAALWKRPSENTHRLPPPSASVIARLNAGQL
ncbi:hypothetical protein WJX73_009671 [Symbiochloris irregularis]|uniref:protein-serine/threonine phosphatase n=1 Tax=Symbiochloris irregularis TaxID=706552 RepID=A0AAW1P808_9CHLO